MIFAMTIRASAKASRLEFEAQATGFVFDGCSTT
jgi:hypothetical protein